MRAFLLLGLTLFLSCEEATDWKLNVETNGKLVVDAILTNELRVQEIRLSQSYDDLNGKAITVQDADVAVMANNIKFNFDADLLHPGLYKSRLPFLVFKNLTYQLEIDWRGQRYTATSQLSDVAPIPRITFQPSENEGELIFDQVPAVFNANQQAMYEMVIDWSKLDANLPNKAKVRYYTFSEVDVSQLVPPARDTVTFPAGSLVYIEKFGLNDEFAAYLRALAIETDWRGGLFYSSPSNLPTNISNGGLGFFSTCAILRDTIIAR